MTETTVTPAGSDMGASEMRRAMEQQPALLTGLLKDWRPVEQAAARLAGHRILLTGTGTSWHAAAQGAIMLRMAGVDAWPAFPADLVSGTMVPRPGDALLVLSHRGTKKYTNQVYDIATSQGIPVLLVSNSSHGRADIPTCPEETSAAFTVSHLTALFRVAQLAVQWGADLDLAPIPSIVAAALRDETALTEPPARALDFAGVGINAWTAREGALKTRETSYVAAAGWACEQLIHGPVVALCSGDTLVTVGTEIGSDREPSQRLCTLEEVARAHGARVVSVRTALLPDPLSIFPLTVAVQKIAHDVAAQVGANPDSFGRDLPGRAKAWQKVQL